ncbi:aldehyde dehydrogenase domain-containing protein [Naematelia encephala]|uniref:Aldehyde dehydrogenase domain-containing protein n=1 Tax=Naematelia encephala TaxID=71784 RepID=A0A1Y2B2R2_9TREE|nr:aldehyde dehydrogenase domain-containing protein [Naematelia encephala]
MLLRPFSSVCRLPLNTRYPPSFNHRYSHFRHMTTRTSLTLPSGSKLEIPVGLYINNELVAASDNQTFETRIPATGEKLLDVQHATAEDVDKAVKAARKAFKTTWGNTIHATERAALLNKFADLIERDLEKLAIVESINGGKGIRMAKEVDIPDSVACLRYYAGLADKGHGQSINSFGTDKFVYTLHQPIGVCGQIIPWNYPIQMWAWKVAPALAAGCTIVMKPSELTPLTALMLNELAIEAGFPPGVVNTLPGLGATTGDAISRHMEIDKIAFTGSVLTGRKISKAAADSNLKKVTLELGGKSPIVVFASADLEDAAEWVATAIWFNSGQDCTAGSRLYIEEPIYDKFLEVLKTKADSVAIGLPEDDKTSFGPLISKLQQEKVLGFIKSGKDQGARLITGGSNWDGSPNGYYVQPTIFADTTPGMKIVQEEIFGPVIAASRFTSETQAIDLANSTVYGLGAAVFTNDSKQAMRVSAAIDSGTVWVNHYMMVHNGVPFGGFKQSGTGRELGTYGLSEYQEVKAVHHNLAIKPTWPL